MDRIHKNQKGIPASKIDNLEQSLYTNGNDQSRIRTGNLHSAHVTVEKDWSKVNTQERDFMNNEQERQILNESLTIQKKSSFLKKFFMSSLLFFLVAVGFGVYAFFIKNRLNPEGNITIGVVGSTFTKGGEALPLKVQIENDNDFALEVVDLIVAYPRVGDVPTDSLDTTERDRISLGTINPSTQMIKDIPITLFGKEGDKKTIDFTLEYTIANSSTIFQKKKTYQVTLSSSPITTRIIASDTAVPNQPYHFTVEVGTTTTKPLDNIMLAVEYPLGFTFTSANLPSYSNNKLWDLGTLTPGTPKTLEVYGTFAGVDGDERSIRTLFGTYEPRDKTTISTNLGTLIQTVLLQKPFLSTELAINSSTSNTVALLPGEQVQGVLHWKNNLPNQVLDLEIQVRLKGDYFDREHIDIVDGFYNSSTDTIVWNKNTVDSFVRIPAGATGSLYFTIPTFPPKTDGSVKNPKLDFDIAVKALEDSEGTTPKTIESLESVSARIGGNLKITPFVLFKTGPFANSGTVPPKINTPMNYTVVLPIINTINAYSGAVLKAKLPPNVTYNKVFSPDTELVSYDEKTGEIIWSIGNISTDGTQQRSVAIQLEVTPSLSQVGGLLPLLNTVTVNAVDQFTGKPYQALLGTITNNVGNSAGESQIKNSNIVTK